MNLAVDVWTDPELDDLVRTDPGLVAIADVLTEASRRTRLQKRPPARRGRYLAVAAVLLVAAALPTVALSHRLQNFLGLTPPPADRSKAQATLIDPIPRNAPGGSTVTVRWKLWSRDQHGNVVPFGAAQLFARIVNPARTEVTTSPARCHNGRKAIYCHDGQFYARIRVPNGGIGGIQIGILGFSLDAPGQPGRSKPAPGLFPITNYP